MGRCKKLHADRFEVDALEPRVHLAADLVSGGLTYPRPTGARAMPFTYSVANIGDQPVAAGVQVHVFVSTDTTFSSDDVLVRRSVVPDAIPAGGRVRYDKTLLLNLGIEAGTHLIMVIDPNNLVPEQSERNNTLTGEEFSVYFYPRAESVTIDPPNPVAGQEFDVVFSGVRNVLPNNGTARVSYSLGPGLGGAIATAPVINGTARVRLTVNPAWGTGRITFHTSILKGNSVISDIMLVDLNIPIVPPTIDRVELSSSAALRGSFITLSVIGASPDVRLVAAYFDSNFDGVYQGQTDQGIGLGMQQFDGNWQIRVRVPIWLPIVPVKIFVWASTSSGVFSRTLVTELRAIDPDVP